MSKKRGDSLRNFSKNWEKMEKEGAFKEVVYGKTPKAEMDHIPAVHPAFEKVRPELHIAVDRKEIQLTFQEVIAALRRVRPGVPLGETAKQGEYYGRAIGLTNFEMHPGDPLRYGAIQGNGKTMWLYVGARGTKICCGDKPW